MRAQSGKWTAIRLGSFHIYLESGGSEVMTITPPPVGHQGVPDATWHRGNARADVILRQKGLRIRCVQAPIARNAERALPVWVFERYD